MFKIDCELALLGIRTTFVVQQNHVPGLEHIAIVWVNVCTYCARICCTCKVCMLTGFLKSDSIKKKKRTGWQNPPTHAASTMLSHAVTSMGSHVWRTQDWDSLEQARRLEESLYARQSIESKQSCKYYKKYNVGAMKRGCLVHQCLLLTVQSQKSINTKILIICVGTMPGTLFFAQSIWQL